MALRRSAQFLLAAALLVPGVAVQAAEKGQIIRPGDLLAQPFIDAASTAKLAAAQPVTVVERRGAWVNVQANGKSGWVRLLNLRLEAASGPVGTLAAPPRPKPSGGLSLTSLMGTKSSGRTVTTGVKGMDEENIRAASPDYAELELFEKVAALTTEQDARNGAATGKLTERTVAYLTKKAK